jgi:3D (Asp-Asp-Asp) domain-containing protein
MRRRDGLTNSERWDVALLVLVFVFVLAVGAAIWKSSTGNGLVAFAAHLGSGPTAERGSNVTATEIPQRSELVPVDDAAPVSDPPLPPLDERRAIDARPTPAKPTALAKPAIVYKWYNGEKYRYLKTMRMRVTAYAPDGRCCWPYAGTTTASGESVKTNHGNLVAADTRLLPFGSLVSVPGYHGGEAVPVLDRGGAIKGHRLDVLLPNFAQAQDWGARLVDVKIYVPVDE